MNNKGTPVVTDIKVIPVAGYDSMSLTLSGAHAPFFIRNIIIISDNSGNVGLGEIHGGERIRQALENYKPVVIGKHIGDYKNIIRELKDMVWCENQDNGEGLQKLDLKNLCFVVHAETAVESALLDLLGQYMNLPVASLLGDGKQRGTVRMLGYLFYVGDKNRTDLPYIDESDSNDIWFKVRRNKMVNTEDIIEQAHAVKEKYGVKDFKLKGGVFSGEKEMETVKALSKEFPHANINIDPNGAWSLDEAIKLCREAGNDLSYVEDPCGPENGFSGREIMTEFKRATGLRVATNMIATNWRQFGHCLSLNSLDIILADPHFWTMNGAVCVAQICNEWGYTWGSHSNNHFDISLAIFAQVAAAAPGEIIPMDTHWIWQDGQYLTKNPYSISNGLIELPKEPGLGLKVDMDKVMEANKLYNKIGYKDRDDSMAMQYLIENWKFNSKKPCMIR
jgi:glucarate dehydratase